MTILSTSKTNGYGTTIRREGKEVYMNIHILSKVNLITAHECNTNTKRQARTVICYYTYDTKKKHVDKQKEP